MKVEDRESYIESLFEETPSKVFNSNNLSVLSLSKEKYDELVLEMKPKQTCIPEKTHSDTHTHRSVSYYLTKKLSLQQVEDDLPEYAVTRVPKHNKHTWVNRGHDGAYVGDLYTGRFIHKTHRAFAS